MAPPREIAVIDIGPNSVRLVLYRLEGRSFRPVLNGTVLAGLGRPYEVVFVDDGSRDRSLEILKAAAAANPGTVKVVELVRNAGQHMAILAAFTATDGEVVITLDADLQNPPEEIPKVVAAMDAGPDVVAIAEEAYRRFATENM